jgi:hypothetical protein
MMHQLHEVGQVLLIHHLVEVGSVGIKASIFVSQDARVALAGRLRITYLGEGADLHIENLETLCMQHQSIKSSKPMREDGMVWDDVAEAEHRRWINAELDKGNTYSGGPGWGLFWARAEDIALKRWANANRAAITNRPFNVRAWKAFLASRAPTEATEGIDFMSFYGPVHLGPKPVARLVEDASGNLTVRYDTENERDQ